MPLGLTSAQFHNIHRIKISKIIEAKLESSGEHWERISLQLICKDDLSGLEWAHEITVHTPNNTPLLIEVDPYTLKEIINQDEDRQITAYTAASKEDS